MTVSSVRIPFAGLENPAWAGWSHGDVPCAPKKRRAPHGPANCVRVQVSQGMRSGQLVDRPLPMPPLRAPDLILHAPRPRVHGGFPYSLFLENFGLLTLVAECPLMAKSRPKRWSRHTSALPRIADIRGAMSAFAAITSASPPGADVPGSVAECRLMTQSGH